MLLRGVPISLKTHKRLWSNAGNTCAFPGCVQRLLVPTEGDDDEIVVGKECHIVAQRDGGPRAPDTLTAAETVRWRHLIDDRDGYANLVLMCGVHHDVIDGDVQAYSVERLIEIKATHERDVDDARSSERRHQDALEVRYAAIIDEWARRIHIDEWDQQVSSIAISGQVQAQVLEELEEVQHWLLTRVWPRTFPDLEAALHNFRMIAEDLVAVVGYYDTMRGDTVLVDRVYKEQFYEKEVYDFLSARSRYNQDLAADLAVELTRAVNLVADRVREFLWPSHRLQEGYATIGLGLNHALVFETLRPLYATDAPPRPYTDLEAFLEERATRDYARGNGRPPAGAGLPGLALDFDA